MDQPEKAVHQQRMSPIEDFQGIVQDQPSGDQPLQGQLSENQPKENNGLHSELSSSTSASSQTDSEVESSDSSPSTIPTDVTLTESSSEFDTEEYLGSPSLKTYKLVGDNIDKNIRPREMRSDHQTKSLHYFHTYGVRDRVDISEFSNRTPIPDVPTINLTSLLPSSADEEAILKNFSILAARTLKKYISFFSKFGQGLERHIKHEFSVEMGKKSDVVSVIVYNNHDIHVTCITYLYMYYNS